MIRLADTLKREKFLWDYTAVDWTKTDAEGVVILLIQRGYTVKILSA